jgi:hypothetical protein
MSEWEEIELRIPDTGECDGCGPGIERALSTCHPLPSSRSPRRFVMAHCARNLRYMSQVGAAASPEDIQPRHEIRQLAILAREFVGVSRIELGS